MYSDYNIGNFFPCWVYFFGNPVLTKFTTYLDTWKDVCYSLDTKLKCLILLNLICPVIPQLCSVYCFPWGLARGKSKTMKDIYGNPVLTKLTTHLNTWKNVCYSLYRLLKCLILLNLVLSSNPSIMLTLLFSMGIGSWEIEDYEGLLVIRGRPVSWFWD